jgi:hypothetical protein
MIDAFVDDVLKNNLVNYCLKLEYRIIQNMIIIRRNFFFAYRINQSILIQVELNMMAKQERKSFPYVNNDHI